jgi:hypothetical protein
MRENPDPEVLMQLLTRRHVWDWRKNGEALRDFMKQQLSRIVARDANKKVRVGEFRDAASTTTQSASDQEIHLEFMQAIETLVRGGNPLLLEKYLRSERPLGRQERKF